MGRKNWFNGYTPNLNGKNTQYKPHEKFCYSGCQNYRTERRGQKYGKIPYLCPLPGSNLERSRKI